MAFPKICNFWCHFEGFTYVHCMLELAQT